MTRPRSLFLVSIALLVLSLPAVAALKDIHAEKLPQDPAVQKVFADALSVEDMVVSWSPEWRYETPKDKVAALLKGSIEQLQKASAASPDNPELLLLTGLVAHYAYNVDVSNSYKLVVTSLESAKKIGGDDYRSEWFLGIHECQANSPKNGMDRLLAIESRVDWQKLSVTFWDDYMECANLANVPVHLIRAGDRVERLHASSSKMRDFLVQIAHKRFVQPDTAAKYSYKDVWLGEQKDNGTAELKNYMFGFSFVSQREWRLGLNDVQQGQCVLVAKTGPHKGRAGQVTPNIVVLVRAPKQGETIEGFATEAIREFSPSATEVPTCPSDRCAAFEVKRPGLYGGNGDGYALVTAFERAEPEYPGLLLEETSGMPSSDKAGDTKSGKGKVAYFHPTERIHRVKGTLYYLVMLDTATSVIGEAKRDYENFLKGMKVE